VERKASRNPEKPRYLNTIGAKGDKYTDSQRPARRAL
jgi:hypothetical protein